MDKIIDCLDKLSGKRDVIVGVWERIGELKLKEWIEKEVLGVE